MNARFLTHERFDYGGARAPKGYTNDRPLVIAGKPFVGGEWIPEEVLANATPEKKRALGGGTGKSVKTPLHQPKDTASQRFHHFDHNDQQRIRSALLDSYGKAWDAWLQHGDKNALNKIKHVRDFFGSIGEGQDDLNKAYLDAAKRDYSQHGVMSRAFKSWFGDWEEDAANASKVVDKDTGEPSENYHVTASKVVNEHGTPAVMYHGTAATFTTFDKTKSRSPENLFGAGFYFTDDSAIAMDYHHARQPPAALPIDNKEAGKKIAHTLRRWLKSAKREAAEADSSWKQVHYDMRVRELTRDLAAAKAWASGKLTTEDKKTLQSSNINDAMEENFPGSSGDVHAVYLNIRKPLDLSQKITKPEDAAPFIAALLGKDTPEFKRSMDQMRLRFENPKEYERIHGTPENDMLEDVYTKTVLDLDNGLLSQLGWKTNDKEYNQHITLECKNIANERLAAAGYDGLTHIGGHRAGGGHEHRVWIAFEPNQIKSVNNRGTFSSNEDNINYSRSITDRLDYGGARAPKGYTQDRPLVIAGQPFVGGEWIPGSVLAKASEQQKRALGGSAGKSGPKPTPQLSKHEQAVKANFARLTPEQQAYVVRSLSGEFFLSEDFANGKPMPLRMRQFLEWAAKQHTQQQHGGEMALENSQRNFASLTQEQQEDIIQTLGHAIDRGDLDVQTQQRAQQFLKWARDNTREQLLFKQRQRLSDVLDTESTREQPEQTKARIASELGTRLMKNDDFMKLANAMIPPSRRELRYNKDGTVTAEYIPNYSSESELAREAVSFLVSKWAGTSADSDEMSLAVQRAARDEFNLHDTYGRENESTKRFIDDVYDKHSKALRAFVREQYNHTQEWLAKNGIKEVTLYRGMRAATGPEETESEEEVALQPLSSFSTDPDVAMGFTGSGEHDIVMAMRVPASRILGSCQTGFGCKNEAEMVVLGGVMPAVVARDFRPFTGHNKAGQNIVSEAARRLPT